MDFKTSLAVCKVVFWDEIETKERTEYNIVNGHSFAECAEELQNYYGAQLCTVEITLLEEGATPISKDFAEYLLKSGFIGDD